LLNKTFNYARSKGVTIVVSAGNAATDLDHNGNTYQTFCDTPAVICVAATGRRPTRTPVPERSLTNIDAPAYYTNFDAPPSTWLRRVATAPSGRAPPAGHERRVRLGRRSQTSLIIGCFSSPNFIVGAQARAWRPARSGTAALLVSILGRNPGQIKARFSSRPTRGG